MAGGRRIFSFCKALKKNMILNSSKAGGRAWGIVGRLAKCMKIHKKGS